MTTVQQYIYNLEANTNQSLVRLEKRINKRKEENESLEIRMDRRKLEYETLVKTMTAMQEQQLELTTRTNQLAENFTIMIKNIFSRLDEIERSPNTP